MKFEIEVRFDPDGHWSNETEQDVTAWDTEAEALAEIPRLKTLGMLWDAADYRVMPVSDEDVLEPLIEAAKAAKHALDAALRNLEQALGGVEIEDSEEVLSFTASDFIEKYK